MLLEYMLIALKVTGCILGVILMLAVVFGAIAAFVWFCFATYIIVATQLYDAAREYRQTVDGPLCIIEHDKKDTLPD